MAWAYNIRVGASWTPIQLWTGMEPTQMLEYDPSLVLYRVQTCKRSALTKQNDITNWSYLGQHPSLCPSTTAHSEKPRLRARNATEAVKEEISYQKQSATYLLHRNIQGGLTIHLESLKHNFMPLFKMSPVIIWYAAALNATAAERVALVFCLFPVLASGAPTVASKRTRQQLS